MPCWRPKQLTVPVCSNTAVNIHAAPSTGPTRTTITHGSAKCTLTFPGESPLKPEGKLKKYDSRSQLEVVKKHQACKTDHARRNTIICTVLMPVGAEIEDGVRYAHISWDELHRLYEFDHHPLAYGGYGSIHIGRLKDSEDPEEIVLKAINLHSSVMRKYRKLAAEPLLEVRKYVLREWKALRSLHHPNIVSAKSDVIYCLTERCTCGGDHRGLDSDNDTIYVLVMERMHADVFDLMHHYHSCRRSPTRLKIASFNELPNTRLPPRLARRIFYDIAKALDFLHEKPLLHRDVSWGNIMVKFGGGDIVAKLVDLGLTRDLPKTTTLLSSEGIGTLAFCAPELAFSEYKTCGYGTRIDVWSLGITLYLMLTGNADRNQRCLRFRDAIDSIEYEHEACIEARTRDAGSTQSCYFCREVVNDRFAENVDPAELAIKKAALPLLEQMLRLVPEERMSIKQVLSHEWLAEERARDSNPPDTEEETVLMDIPRPQGPPLRVVLRKSEYPYIQDSSTCVLASTFRELARSVSMGDVTTFGGVLSRLGIQSGERMLQHAPPFADDTYLVCLDDQVPRRLRAVYFRHLYLALLDNPNDIDCVYRLYRALRALDLHDCQSVMMPLLGFDMHIETDSPFKPHVGPESRKKFILQMFLSLACHIATSYSNVERLVLLTWKRSTYSLVKSSCAEWYATLFGPTSLFDSDNRGYGMLLQYVGETVTTMVSATAVCQDPEMREQFMGLAKRLSEFRTRLAESVMLHGFEDEDVLCSKCGQLGRELIRRVRRGPVLWNTEQEQEAMTALFHVVALGERASVDRGSEQPSGVTRFDVVFVLCSLVKVLQFVAS